MAFTGMHMFYLYMYIHVLMRDEKEGSKQGRTCTCRDEEGGKKEASKHACTHQFHIIMGKKH